MRNHEICQKLLVLFISIAAAMPLYGQQSDIRGKVIDEISGEPLPGVAVIVDGTIRGTASDALGQFVIWASPDETLLFNYLGYETLRVKAGTVKAEGVVLLKQDATDIEQIVMIGYGTQKKASVVASIMQTSGEELLKSGYVNSLSEALQGKLNGLIAVNKEGLPGESSADMYIRGKATWHSTSPLVLVDGAERNMEDIDINEIETLSVLKDASATAVYGVRGGNGVIMITTKRGNNEKLVVSFTANFGIKQPTTNLKWADYLTAMKAFNNALVNDNNWSALIPQSTIDAWTHAYATGNYGPYNDVFPQVNWWDELSQNGFSQSYNVNIRGGSDFVRYFASVGYQHDGDIYDLQKQEYFDPSHSYQRYNWRSNLDFNLTKSTLLSVNIAGNMAYQDKTFAADPYLRILTAPTNTFPVKYSDGEWGGGYRLRQPGRQYEPERYPHT